MAHACCWCHCSNCTPCTLGVTVPHTHTRFLPHHPVPAVHSDTTPSPYPSSCSALLHRHPPQLPATAVDDVSSVSLVLRNTSSCHAYLFDWGVPVNSWLALTPRVGQLPPGGSVRLQLDFSPPASLLEDLEEKEEEGEEQEGAGATGTKQEGPTAAAAAGDSGGGSNGQQEDGDQKSEGDEGSEGAPPPPRRVCRKWLLPCFVKLAAAGSSTGCTITSSSGKLGGTGSAAAAGATSGRAGSGKLGATGTTSTLTATTTSSSSSGGGEVLPLHLQVCTCAVAPELVVTGEGLGRPEGKNYWVVDYGAVPVGERVVKPVTLTNTGGRLGGGGVGGIGGKRRCVLGEGGVVQGKVGGSLFAQGKRLH